MVIYSNQSPGGFGSLGLELSSERGIVKTLNTEREYKSMCPSRQKKKKNQLQTLLCPQFPFHLVWLGRAWPYM